MAAKEKGKIVSASPDSPTLEKLSTFSQQIRSALHCFSAVATRTNALWQSQHNHLIERMYGSQPARMRCGKVSGPCRRSQKSPVATRANALWQRWVAIQIFSVVTSQPARMRCGKVMRLAKRLQPTGRNPRECAVAKSRHCCARTENSENMNYVLLF